MRVPSHPTLIRRMLDARLKEMAPAGPILAASLSEVQKTCGKPSCACHHGGDKHNAWHLTLRERGKTRTVYVPKGLLDDVRSWVAEHQRLKRLRAEISRLSLALVTTHVTQRKRKKGRP
jgi:hypothetical protein